MATSPNYAWAEPDNSSLVKNGAQDIRALGDAIDTSVWNVGFGQAGKNKIINGDFGIWQRSTSATVTSENYFAPDRYLATYVAGGATVTWSRQTFTPGAAPVAGYEGQFFSRMSATSGSGTTVIGLNQRIEDVRTLAGQTATLSFWAKADSARTLTLYWAQSFGSGGSPNQQVLLTTQAITTSWTRYSFTTSVPSVSGKTIGAGSYSVPYIYLNTGAASGTPQLDLWGIQVEAGSVATPFQTATGTLQGELAACQRYYYKISNGNGSPLGLCMGETTNLPIAVAVLPVTMRVAPSLDATSGTNYYWVRTANNFNNFNSFTLETTSPTFATFYSTGTIVSGAGGRFGCNSTSSYVGFSAEL